MLIKEDWIPPFADKPVFVIAPAVIMVTRADGLRRSCRSRRACRWSISTSACCSSSPCRRSASTASSWPAGRRTTSTRSSAALRAAAQMLSYEVFMGLSLMGVVMLAGSFNLRDIVEAQRGLVVLRPADPRFRRLRDRRHRRDPPAAVRFAGSGERTGRRLSTRNIPG